MFRKFAIALIDILNAVAAILETTADAIAATLTSPPAAESPRLRLVASGGLLLRR